MAAVCGCGARLGADRLAGSEAIEEVGAGGVAAVCDTRLGAERLVGSDAIEEAGAGCVAAV
ncbi:hypothetical protein BURKHO8Y_140484 [Burkholderia sp. 8Y]|nr:hypothetical protein BURKHO8Y_140484 [Burkholderia sp. 8Y]